MTEAALFSAETMPITIEGANRVRRARDPHARARLPALGGEHKMTQRKADDELAMMRAVLVTLQGLRA